MHDDVCYQKSFLKEVVARVDFSSPLESLAVSLPLKVGNAALARFPIGEPRKTLARELQLSADAIRHTEQEVTEWHYYGRDREKRLVISAGAAFVSYSRYATYEALQADFLSVVNLLFSEFPDLRASRLGLRYINHIEPAGAGPFDWDSYIDARLLGLFARFTERECITRLFNIAEFKFDDLQVRFQFGAPNPDFPATMRRALYVLDIDAFVAGLQDLADVKINMDRAHVRAQVLFEESITEKLREVMHGN